jgi:hypothetical protein
MSTDHLLSLAGMYAEAHGKAERFRALAETRPARRAEFQAGADRWTAAAAGLHANLRAELRDALHTTVHAAPDDALPVCTRNRRFVDIRATFNDGERGIRVRYTLAQAVSAGAAMIACAAVAEGGDALETILPAFPPGARPHVTTPPPGPARGPDGGTPDGGNPS